MFVRRSFTIAVMLCATLAAGAQAQTNQSGAGGKSLVELEAQAKAKKKATTASNETAQQQTTPPDDGTTATKPTTTVKKSTVKKAPVRTTSARTTTAKRTTVVARKPAPKPAATPATAADTTASATTPQGGATPAAAPAAQPAPQAPPADPGAPKIYKSGTLPDEFKFEKEKSREKKPVTEGSGADAAPASAPAESTTTPPTHEASAVAPPASPAPDAPAASAPVMAAPERSAEKNAERSAEKNAEQKTAAPATQKAPDKGKPAPAPVRTAAKTSPAGSHRWRDRGYISGNAGWQASSATFTDTRTLNLTTGDTEPRHLTASYEVKAGPMFDMGAAFRLVKNLGIGVAVTRFSLSNDIVLDATVPHPFFFNTQRPVSGTTPGTREELAIHLDAVYVVPGKKLQVAIFGGPTFFNAKQAVVSDFTYTDVYPFDNPPTFTAGVGAQESKSVTGFNVGADIGYFFNDVFGVGGVVRFSRGTFASSIGDLDLGGPQLSAGVRIRLRQGAPSTKAKTPPPPKKK
jgi:hypothetical protein